MSSQLLCQCLSPHVWQRGCFSNWIQNIKLVVLAVYILLLSCFSQTKHFQILASPVNRTFFPWSLWKLSSRVDFMSAFSHQQKRLSLASTNLALFHVVAFTLSAQKEALRVMFKPMAVPSVNLSIRISEISIEKEIFKRKRNVQLTTRAHFYPPFCFFQNSTAVAS